MTTLVVLLGLLGQAVTADVPPDFSVRIEYGLCKNESVDTATGVFSRTILSEEIRTARFTLTRNQRQRLYQLVNRAGIFDYPAEFKPALTFMSEPAPDYIIEVQNEGRRHVVR